MSDLHTENTVYLLHVAACAYLRAHHLTRREFGSLDDRYHNFVDSTTVRAKVGSPRRF